MKIFNKKNFLRKCTMAFAGTLLLTTVVQATSLTKKIDATFKNIKVHYNNQEKVMAQEPFIYNNNVYLPVRAVADLVDKKIDWNSSLNSVYVTDKGGMSSDALVQTLQAQLGSKDLEIAKLNGEKSLLESRIKELEKGKGSNDKVTSGDLKDTLAYIEDFFDYEHSIDWEFGLTETSSRINLEVSFDSRYDDKKWDKLTKKQREGFFRDISREIRMDIKDTPINGKVIDRRTDKTIGSFTYSKTNSFSYNDDSSTSFDLLERDLIKAAKKVDGTDIPVDDIAIKGNEDDITFTVYVDLYNRSLENQWDDAMKDNPREIRKLMEYIQEEILRDYKYADVQGFIEDLESANTLAKFDGKRLY